MRVSDASFATLIATPDGIRISKSQQPLSVGMP
jgi:hypothetical protein